MKYIYIILLACLFIRCNSQINKNDIKEQEVSNDFSLNEIKSIYFIDKKEKLNIELFTQSYSAIDIDSLMLKLLNTYDFKKKTKKIGINQKKELFKKANDWLNVKNVIDFAIDNSENVDYLEYFYYNNTTKKLFKKYLKNPNQDWGSLSSSEQYEVYYAIITEIYILNSKDRLLLISDFYNKMR